jgi:hypothetical protein
VVDGLSLSVSLTLHAPSLETLDPVRVGETFGLLQKLLVRHPSSGSILRTQKRLFSSCPAVGQFFFLRFPGNRDFKKVLRGDNGCALASRIVLCVKAVWVIQRQKILGYFWQVMF